MKNTMKKVLAVALVILMTIPVMALGVSATGGTPVYKEYADAQDGDLLYAVNFNGTTGVYKPIDGRGEWYKTNAAVSADGTSVTLGYTTEARSGVTVSQGRARYCSDKMDKFDVKGRSYTVQFTLNSTAPVGVHLDGNTGFVINPSENATWIGQSAGYGRYGAKETYEGTPANEQTYAIEFSGSATATGNLYYPTVYRLFVQDAEGKWTLIREIGTVTIEGEHNGKDMASFFEFEKNYEYFYLSINCYEVPMKDADGNNIDADGNILTEGAVYARATVSNMGIYKGIDFIEKNGVTTPENGENNENNDGNDSQNTQNTAPETFAPPTSVTEAPETDAETEAPAKGGCGGNLALAGVTLVTVCAAGVALKSAKKKEE